MSRSVTWLRCIPCPVILVLGIVGFVVMAGWAWHIVTKTLSGGALEHCCVIGGVPFNYIGAFALIIGAAFALAIAGAFQIRDWLAWRALRTRYGIERKPGGEAPGTSRWSGTRDTGDFDAVD